jgi:hypothetical protein
MRRMYSIITLSHISNQCCQQTTNETTLLLFSEDLTFSDGILYNQEPVNTSVINDD